jgi:hypothetical protein
VTSGRRLASRVIYGSCGAVLVSEVVVVWFLFGQAQRLAGRQQQNFGQGDVISSAYRSISL